MCYVENHNMLKEVNFRGPLPFALEENQHVEILEMVESFTQNKYAVAMYALIRLIVLLSQYM